MSLVIVALLLFIGMVAAWVVLPGSMVATPLEESGEPLAANAVGQSA